MESGIGAKWKRTEETNSQASNDGWHRACADETNGAASGSQATEEIGDVVKGEL